MIEIHRCLRSVCGEDAIDVSSVRCWIHHFRVVERKLVTGPAAVDQPQQHLLVQ